MPDVLAESHVTMYGEPHTETIDLTLPYDLTTMIEKMAERRAPNPLIQRQFVDAVRGGKLRVVARFLRTPKATTTVMLTGDLVAPNLPYLGIGVTKMMGKTSMRKRRIFQAGGTNPKTGNTVAVVRVRYPVVQIGDEYNPVFGFTCALSRATTDALHNLAALPA